MLRLKSFTFLFFVGFITSAAQESPRLPVEEFRAIQDDYQEARRTFEKAVQRAATDDEVAVLRAKYLPNQTFCRRALELARRSPEDPVAVDALVWVAGGRWSPDDEFLSEQEQALKLLTDRYSASNRLATLAKSLPYDRPRQEVEALLRAILKNNSNQSAQGEASYGLAYLLRERLKQIESHRQLIELEQNKARNPWPGTDPVTLQNEIESLLENIIKNHGLLDWGRRAKQAESDLFEIRNLWVGRKAPEIEGLDAVGEKFKLSDYRGKVLVVDFWASWCGPCLAMVPHQQEMIKRLTGKPFVLLGVNVDNDVKTLRKTAQDKQMKWRHWFDGPRGPIQTRWNVTAFPMVYVIDAQGVIRYRGHDLRGKVLDAAVDRLLMELPTRP